MHSLALAGEIARLEIVTEFQSVTDCPSPLDAHEALGRR